MYKDKRGVEYSDDKKTLLRVGERMKGEYKVLAGVTTIKGRNNGNSGACYGICCQIILPDSLIAIEDCAFQRCEIDNVVLPNGLQSIGSDAFNNSQITKIYIPASVTHIGDAVFSQCKSLVSIVVDPANPVYDSRDNCNAIIETKTNTLIAGCKNSIIPDGVEHIGKQAFEHCKLTSVSIPDSVTSIDDYAFADCDLAELKMGNGVKTIGSHAFYNCGDLENIPLPEGLTTIGDHAFYSIYSLKCIDIPNSVTEIGDQAFRSCSGLTGIHIPDNVVRIGEWAFEGCDSLKSIHIGSGVQTIGKNAFSSLYSRVVESITVDPANPVYDSRGNCNAIIETKTNTLIAGCKNTKIPDDIEHIALSAFSCCKEIEHIELPKGVKTIGMDAFSSCENLTSIVIPEGITNIEQSTFSYCKNLVPIHIPNSVTYIGKYAFYECDNLTSITIGENVKTIDQGAFSGCANLTSVTIGEKVEVIGEKAFYRCEKLISIVIPASVKVIGWYAFDECSTLSAVVFNGQIEKIGGNFSKCPCLARIIVPKGTKEQYAKLFPKQYMPSNIQKLSEGNPSSVSPVSIQDDGELVYADEAKTILHACKPTATTIVVPETVKKINPDAFVECKELTSVTLGLGTKSVKTINKKLFRKCKKLKQVVLGDSITVIAAETFAYDGWKDLGNPNLESITIPASLKRIGRHAFNSANKLTEVHIADVAAWCNIEFDGEAANPIGINRGATKYAHHLYLGDEEIHDLVIPEGVTYIQEALFAGCADFTSVTIPNTVKEIGARAFKECTGLKTVVIPDSVTKIGRDAFDGTINLVYHGATRWEQDNLWWGARCLNGYVDGDFVYDSESKTVLCGCLKADIGDVVIPNSVTKIGDRAFQGCSGMTSIVIPEGVKEIGKNAFEGCSALKFITIPESVKEIAYSTFSGCMNLSSVTIPDSVKELSSEIFHGCTNLQMVRIPEGVENIGDFAFFSCARLTEITIPKSVKYFCSWAFHSCAGLETMVFQGPVELSYWCLYGCNNLKHVIIPQGTKDHFLKQNEGTDLGIKNFADILEEEGSNVAEQQQEVITLLTMAQGFDKGIGVPKNGEMAVSLYKQAADKGSPEAAYRLGVCYRDGEYVPQDKDAALTYFRQAAESKYKDSEEQVAKLQQ